MPRRRFPVLFPMPVGITPRVVSSAIRVKTTINRHFIFYFFFTNRLKAGGGGGGMEENNTKEDIVYIYILTSSVTFLGKCFTWSCLSL